MRYFTGIARVPSEGGIFQLMRIAKQINMETAGPWLPLLSRLGRICLLLFYKGDQVSELSLARPCAASISHMLP